MKPINSVISGLPSRAPPGASSTGGGRGEIGSVAISSDGQGRDMHPEVMARPPSANTGAALSRMLSFGVECFVKMETVFPTSQDGDTTFRQRPISLTVNIASSADLPAALRVINASLAPASVHQIEEWLAVLSVKTVPRVDSVGRTELMVSTYAGHLREYPADVVRYVLSSWSSKWWPTWGELAERLDELTDQRLMIRDHLRDLVAGRAPSKPVIDEAARRLAELREEAAAAQRLMAKYPELSDSSERRLQEIVHEIAALEARK